MLLGFINAQRLGNLLSPKDFQKLQAIKVELKRREKRERKHQELNANIFDLQD